MHEWEDTVNRHGPLVWRIANRLLGNEHDAADCYQNVFVEALEVSRRQAIDNWPGFLTRLTTRRAIDLLRRLAAYNRRKDGRQVTQVEDRSANQTRAVEVAETVSRLREAITHLPPDQADAFCLRYFEELTYAQIAERLETDANRVGVLLHRARGLVKQLVLGAETPAD